MKLALIITTLFFSFTAMSSDNPDEGKKVRYLCYKIENPEDASTIDKNFAVVVEQVDTSVQDASFFIPGNKNFKKSVSQPDNFNIFFYENAQDILSKTDVVESTPTEISDRLMQVDTSWRYENVGGLRSLDQLFVNWDNPSGNFQFNMKEPWGNSFTDHKDPNKNNKGMLSCEAPIAIDVAVPNQAPAAPQTSELIKDEDADASAAPANI